MADYIERQAAVEAIKNDACELVYYSKADAISCLEAEPAANVREDVHGKWEIVTGSNGKEYMVCTNCKVIQDLTALFTYCPNCGARMDGEHQCK